MPSVGLTCFLQDAFLCEARTESWQDSPRATLDRQPSEVVTRRNAKECKAKEWRREALTRSLRLLIRECRPPPFLTEFAHSTVTNAGRSQFEEEAADELDTFQTGA
jgi:hypothetical protein